MALHSTFTKVLLFLTTITVVQSACTNPSSDKTQCTFFNVASSTNDGTAVVTVNGVENEAAHLIDGSLADDDNGPISTSKVKITFSRPYHINSITITESYDLGTENEKVKLGFSDGSFKEVTLTYLNRESETKNFPSKATEWVTIEVTRKYDPGLTYFTEIELFYDGCQSEMTCEKFELSSDADTTPSMVLGTNVAFIREDTTRLLTLHLESADQTTKLAIELTDKVKLVDGASSVLDGPVDIPGTGGVMSFWLDTEEESVLKFGIGATTLINYDIGTKKLAWGKLGLKTPITSPEKITFCRRTASCYTNADFYLPLNKEPIDVISHRYAKVYGEAVVDYNGPSTGHSNRASIHLDQTMIDLDFATGCITDIQTCSKGISFSLWLKIHKLFDRTSYYFTAGTGSHGFAVRSPVTADLIDANNPVEIEFQTGRKQWRASVPFTVDTWHHIACAWNNSQGLHCTFDMTTTLDILEYSPWQLFSGVTLGGSSVEENSFSDASFSDLVIWEKKLTMSNFQEIYHCVGLNPGLIGFASGLLLTDDSYTASSYLSDGPPMFAQNSRGGWRTDKTGDDEYIQVDFNCLMEVQGLKIKGNSARNEFVKKFTLLASDNLLQDWAMYKDKDGTYVFDGNTDSSSEKEVSLDPFITARYFRLHPVESTGTTSISVEFITKDKDSNYEGCYPRDVMSASDDLIKTESTPFSCNIACGKLRKKFALLSKGGQCHCVNEIGGNAAVDEQFCHVPCNSKMTLMCGGINHVGVFSVSESGGHTFELSAPFWEKESTSFNISMNSNGYETFKIFNNGYVTTTEHTILELSFMEPGFKSFVVENTVGTIDTEIIQHEHSMFIAPVVQNLNLTCPHLVIATENYHCTLKGYAGRNDVFSYNINGVLQDEIILPASPIGSIGAIAHPHLDVEAVQHGRIFVDAFVQSGIVSLFEVHAQTSGFLNLQIYRPVCGFGDDGEYCDRNGRCSYFHVPCDHLLTFTCTEGTHLHLPTGTCIVGDSYPGMASISSFIPTKYKKYELLYDNEVFAKPGPNTYGLAENDRVGVMEGDVVAISYPYGDNAAVLSVEELNGAEVIIQGELTVGYLEVFEKDVSSLQQRLSIKTSYFVPQEIEMPFTLDHGEHEISVNLENVINRVDLVWPVISNVFIEDLSWTQENIVATHDPYVITGQAMKGYNVTYIVNYGDGEAEEIFQDEAGDVVTFTHHYTSCGYKQLTFRAINQFSDEISYHTALVQDYIVDVNLSSPILPVNHTNTTVINWYIDSGSRVNISFDLGDNYTQYFNESEDINGIVHSPLNHHIYPDPIEYWITITAYNLVNRIEFTTMLIVEKPIVDIKSRINQTNRDIEVNETFGIDITQFQGTNVIHHFEFQDTFTLLTMDTYITKNYSYWSEFDIIITAWNNVSRVTWVQPVKVHKPVIELTDFEITTSPTNHTDPVRFDFTIGTGSDFNCTWDFDDGSYGTSDYWILDSEVYQWPTEDMIMDHMYAGIGVYSVCVDCVSRLYQTTACTTSIVQVPISGFYLDQPPPQANDLDLALHFGAATGTNITYVITFYHIWDQQEIEIDTQQISPSTLEGWATVDLSYYTDRVAYYYVKITAVNLVTPLQTIVKRVIIDRPIRQENLVIHAEFVETNVTVSYTVTADMSNATVRYDFNSPISPDNIQEQYFMGVFPTEGWTVDHKYVRNGFYTLRVTLTNSLGTVVIEKRIIAQHGVYLKITTDSPSPLPPGRINVTFITDHRNKQPTDAQMIMNFGDGKNYTGPYQQTTIHFYTGWGFFNITAEITNVVDFNYFMIVIEIQRTIQGLQMTPYHSDGDAGWMGEARGPLKNHLPLEYDAIWIMDVHDGTDITYEIHYGDGDTVVTQNDTVYHKYDAPGTYMAKVIATNAVSEGKTSFSLNILSVVKGLHVKADCPRKLYNRTKFTMTIDQVGTDSCYLMKFGNNSENYLFQETPDTLCEKSFTDIAHKTIIMSGNEFDVEYTYSFIDIHHTEFIGSNLVSKTRTFFPTVVVHDHCRYPGIDIFNIGKNRSLATDIMKSQSFRIDTQNVIICDASKTTSFLWTMCTLSPELTKDGEEICIPYELPDWVNKISPRFPIDPRMLEYGRYKTRFTITMLGIKGVYGYDEAYFNIVESPLISVVQGGSGISKGIDQDVTLNASMSQDPDVGPNKFTNFTIAWYCKIVGCAAANPSNSGPCGIGTFKLLDTGNAVDLIYLNTSFVKIPSCTYALKLNVEKEHRRMYNVFNIHSFVEEKLIVFLKCLLNCKKKRIQSVKMAYEGGIYGEIADESVEYKWILYKSQEIGRMRMIEESTWEAVTEFEEMIVGTLSDIPIIIQKDMLVSQYRYRLRLYIKSGDREGFAEQELFMNQPPSGGNCTVEPSQGYALDTEFLVKCPGYVDEDTPVLYTVKYSPHGIEKIAYFASQCFTPPILLPPGKKENNYTYEILIDITDASGANLRIIRDVTVLPKPVADPSSFIAEAENIASVDGILGNSKAAGDLHRSSQIVCAVSSTFQELKNNNSTEDDDDSAVDENLTPEENEERARRKREIREEKERKKEENRASITGVRSTLLNATSELTADSLDAVQERATAQSCVLNDPEEINEEMQDGALDSTYASLQYLFNASAGEENPQTTDTSGALLESLGTVLSSVVASNTSNSTSGDEVDTDDYNGNQTRNNSMIGARQRKVMELAKQAANYTLTNIFVGEPAVTVSTDRLATSARRQTPDTMGDVPMETGGGSFSTPNASVMFNSENGGNGSAMAAVSTLVVANKQNPFNYDSSAADVKSSVLTMEIKDADGNPIKIKNLTKPIDMWSPRDLQDRVPFKKYTVAHGKMLCRAFTVGKDDASIHIEIWPADNQTVLFVYLRRGDVFPTEKNHDFMFDVPQLQIDETTNEGNGSSTNKTKATREANPHIFFLSNEDLNRTAAGKYYVCVKYNGTFEPIYEPEIIGGIDGEMKLFVPGFANFTMRTFVSACLFWDEQISGWSTEGCVVGNKTTMEGTQCLCNHLTSFGSDVIVAPNVIDWSAISLDNLLSNPLVFAVVLSFILVYFILLIPARRYDKKDLEKLGVTPLPDNDPRDSYAYEITVYTGFSANAGTTAGIYFVLQGDKDETPVRMLKKPNEGRISVGSINYYLLTLPSGLGKLKNIRIWHDDTGSSPSWYLLRMMIHDIQRDTKTWFLCDRWLAVEEDDGQIERSLRLANSEDLTKFNLLFQTEARKKLSDGHIWFSVIRRPARSTFTRCQRLSCCLCILLTTMLANAMFFQNDPSTSGDGVLVLGPLTFSLQQLSIAITSSLVVLPVNVFVVWIFRNARPKDKKSRYSEKNPKKSSKKDDKSKKNSKEKSLPHWMVYVAYFLIFIACSVSATFTVFYGLTFGSAKSAAWITTMMISFWQDVLISQPLKVFAAAMVFAMLTKDPKKATGEEEEDELPSPELKDDEEFTTKRRNAPRPVGLMAMSRIEQAPPDEDKLKVSRELRKKQKLMRIIIFDIIWYFIFVSVLLSVAYGNKDKSAYDTTNTMSNFFEDNTYTNWIALSEVNDIKLYWYWTRHSLIPTLIPSQWYGPNLMLENAVWVKSDSLISRSRGARSRLQLSGSKRLRLQGRPGEFPDVEYAMNGTIPYPENYIADHATDYTVGVARLRQLRVKPSQCPVYPLFRHLFTECNTGYSWEKEDEGYYSEQWKPQNVTEKQPSNDTESELQKDKKTAWQYFTAWELKGTPYWAQFATYWGGGFVADMGHNETIALNMTKYLQQSGWLDRYTRAIFLEFTVYNPNVNMFCLVTLVTEIIPTGGFYQFNQIYPMRLYRYFGSNLLAIMIMEITLMTFLIYFSYREFKRWRREGRYYWRQGWTYMELLVLATCFSSVGLYFARMVATRYSIGVMREDPESFVSFHYAATLDEWGTITLGLAVFISFLKTLSLLRFNRRVSLITHTIKKCALPVASFFAVYAIVFLAYAILGYFAFGRISTDYHTFTSAMANILGMTLGAFNFHGLVEANRVLGPIFFFTFTFVVNFILINVFVAIICENLAAVTADVLKQPNDHEILDFMVHQFKEFIGQRVAPAIKPIYKEPLPELEAKFDNIEKKSQKAERALRDMCMEEIRQARWFDLDNCSTKKKLLIMLLMRAEDDMTESDICDSIPILDEVLYAYTENDMKEWLRELGQEMDDSKSCRSSMMFSRNTLRYSDEDSNSSHSSDTDSAHESVCEAKWSKIAEENEKAKPPTHDETPESRLCTPDVHVTQDGRPPSTAELFCRTGTTISMTSLNENMASVDHLFADRQNYSSSDEYDEEQRINGSPFNGATPSTLPDPERYHDDSRQMDVSDRNMFGQLRSPGNPATSNRRHSSAMNEMYMTPADLSD